MRFRARPLLSNFQSGGKIWIDTQSSLVKNWICTPPPGGQMPIDLIKSGRSRKLYSNRPAVSLLPSGRLCQFFLKDLNDIFTRGGVVTELKIATGGWRKKEHANSQIEWDLWGLICYLSKSWQTYRNSSFGTSCDNAIITAPWVNPVNRSRRLCHIFGSLQVTKLDSKLLLVLCRTPARRFTFLQSKLSFQSVQSLGCTSDSVKLLLLCNTSAFM